VKASRPPPSVVSDRIRLMAHRKRRSAQASLTSPVHSLPLPVQLHVHVMAS
jgi:hypothetical protein